MNVQLVRSLHGVLDRLARWDHHPRWTLHAAAGCVMGFMMGALTLDSGFVLGTGLIWQQPRGDLVGYLASAYYYLDDRWRVPLFDLPMVNYPEGGSVVYSDALPVAALVAKVLRSLIGTAFNYFGPWMLVSYVAMGGMVARLGWQADNQSLAGSIALSLLALSSTAFNTRIDHIALASQFLIVWALLTYFRGAVGTLRSWEMPVIVAVALLVQPYLFAMVLAILLALADIFWRFPQRRRVIRVGGAAALFVLLIEGPLTGYLSLEQRASIAAQGFGHYSWNVATLIVPGHDSWLWNAPHIVRDATGGQYEGESYLGAGALLLLTICLIASRQRVLQVMSRHRGLLSILLLCGLFAVSNRVYAGPILVADIELPSIVESAAAVFRSSGRFVWPLLYVLTLVPALVLRRSLGHAAWLLVVIGAAALQTIEAAPVRTQVRLRTSTGQPDAIDRPLVESLLRAHDRIWQYPSYFCGGLRGGAGDIGFVWEGQLQFEAARLRRPNNSVMMGRPLKDCGREDRQAMGLQLEPGTLYVFSLDAPSRWPNVAAIARSPACRRLSWSYVCSASWGSSRVLQEPSSANR